MLLHLISRELIDVYIITLLNPSSHDSSDGDDPQQKVGSLFASRVG